MAESEPVNSTIARLTTYPPLGAPYPVFLEFPKRVQEVLESGLSLSRYQPEVASIV